MGYVIPTHHLFGVASCRLLLGEEKQAGKKSRHEQSVIRRLFWRPLDAVHVFRAYSLFGFHYRFHDEQYQRWRPQVIYQRLLHHGTRHDNFQPLHQPKHPISIKYNGGISLHTDDYSLPYGICRHQL